VEWIAGTPITVIEELNIDSRPALRSGERIVEDLWTIPGVFSRTQSRCIFPDWYGLGTGIETYFLCEQAEIKPPAGQADYF
jgi:phosphoenolpyruvate carboxylase